VTQKLKFGKGNAKLRKAITTFSLPAGASCPGALLCKSQVKQGRVVDGPSTEFRCFAASQEAQYKNVFKARKHNFDLLRSLPGIDAKREAIANAMPQKDTGFMRIHVSGDFYNQDYFRAWWYVAKAKPNWLFYAYTKSIPYWLADKDYLPDNFILTASYGGKHDNLISPNRLKHSQVVYSYAEAEAIGYPIDHDDSLAMTPDINFALLLHGIQPKGSEASRALVELKKKGLTGYGR
jgi:hypothetical protein